MTITVATPPATDPRLAAFCNRNAPEVFHSVANPTEIWRADPFDVDTIHAEARAVFRRLLARAAEAKSPRAGKVLLLHGVAGSGKTHLMRAFRTWTHRDGRGYCGYMQMTTEVGNYARYMLQNLIDGLEQRYDPDPDGGDRTGFARLSCGVLDAVPGLTPEDREQFQQEESTNPIGLVIEYADQLAALPAFAGCDLGLIRVLLHLQRPDPRVRNRAFMWLRCQDMNSSDKALLGDIVTRHQDEDPQIMLVHLARLVEAVHQVPLVLLIDQLEDMANQSLPIERFRKLVDAVTSLTDQVPTAVIIIACLEDYYTSYSVKINKSKLDRLENDPEPVRLVTQRELPEIRDMLAARLSYMYSERELSLQKESSYPFTEAHLTPLANLPTRQVLDRLRQHHLKCIQAGTWVEPAFGGAPSTSVPEPQCDMQLGQLWNDFHAAFTAVVPDEEARLTSILADAIRSCGDEQADGYHFGNPRPDAKSPNLIEVETHKPGDVVEQLLVAVCNKKPQGGGLANQVADVQRRSGEIPVALVRTSPFPSTPKTQISKQIADLLKRDGRRVVVENAEWRQMLAFDDFRRLHGAKAGFREWLKAARPLGELKSLQEILRLRALVTSTPRAVTQKPTPTASIASPPIAPLPLPPVPVKPTPAPVSGKIHLGQTISVTPRVAELEPGDVKRHAAFIGGSGSGKTTAALSIVEQLLLRGIPAVLLDRKGDLARYADSEAWKLPPLDPSRVAERDRLQARLDIHLFTPGAVAGRPLGLPVLPHGFAELSENDREQFARFAAAALGSMMGFKGNDADRQQQAILAQAIRLLAETSGTEVTVPALKSLVKDQDDALVTRVGGFKPQVYEKLADRLLTLWLNNKELFAHAGEVLDIDALLGSGPHATPGRTRLTVISTKFLAGADQVDFWVAQFLVAVGKWCAKAPSDKLQAVLLFDEADQYLPATRQPATKGPMTDLLKRARSAGVGVLLATQNPGDFDYKCRENVLTWFVGRVTEQRSLEKLRPVLSAAKGDVSGKLAGQKAGEFHIATEHDVSAVRVTPSLVKTEQLPEERITALAQSKGKGT